MKLELERKTAYADSLRAYRIMINGRQAGKIKQGQKLQMDIQNEGPVTEVYLKVDWCSSSRLYIPYETGKTVSLTCQSNLTGARLFLSLYYIFFRPADYIRLWETKHP